MGSGRKLLGGTAGLFAASVALGALGRSLTPRPDRWLRLGDRRIAITETGSGPPVLFLHGLGGQAGNFHLLLPLLDRFRCIIPDRPGSGWSDPAPPGRTGIDFHAAKAAAIIEALSVAPALVVGHSLGGAIALRLALDRPDLVAAVVCIGALTGPQLPVLAEIGAFAGRRALLREALVRIFGVPLTPALAAWFIKASFSPDRVPPGFAVPGGIFAGIAPRMATALIRDLEVVATGATRLRADLADFAMPVTLLHGLSDRILHHQQHAVPAATLIRGAELWLPDGGHMLPATHPALTAQAIHATASRAGLM